MAPSRAELVICCSSVGIGEDLMGGNDNVIPLQTDFGSDVLAQGVLVAGTVWVVDLHEVIVSVLRVRSSAMEIEDVIRRERWGGWPGILVFRGVRRSGIGSFAV